MLTKPKAPQIPLPKGWQGRVKSAVLHAIALAHYTIVYARAWAADSINARVRLAAENDRLHEECALLPLKNLRCEDAERYRHRPVNCLADRGANIRWTRTPEYGTAHQWLVSFSSRERRQWIWESL